MRGYEAEIIVYTSFKTKLVGESLICLEDDIRGLVEEGLGEVLCRNKFIKGLKVRVRSCELIKA